MAAAVAPTAVLLRSCGTDGVCMQCNTLPPDDRVLVCDACRGEWHMPCLVPPLTAAPAGTWHCPDCHEVEAAMNRAPGGDGGGDGRAASDTADGGAEALREADAAAATAGSGGEGELRARIRAIQSDASLSDAEKARQRQALVSRQATTTASESGGGTRADGAGATARGANAAEAAEAAAACFSEAMKCPICHDLVDRPVTTPCGHNFCLVCFRKWLAQGKRSCAKCRRAVPPDMMKQPRINPVIVAAIRHAKAAAARAAAGGLSTSATPAKQFEPICNEKRPDQAFTTDRAVRKGLSNAASGRIFVTIAGDFFGPITAEYDPERGTGVEVGETWASRLECRQWGAHLPHVAGIAGQSHHGAQSVALSGGYEDDEDNGEWFLYTGSGGRDLSGNKRTNKVHAFDQRFEKSNQALRLSCLKGYPVRVVRSEKERRSSYAPQAGVRYDGVYRIERCWRKKSAVGFLVCRYLFVRCDNSPAPWTSDDVGDSPGRQLPKVAELKHAVDVTERTGPPAWDWIEEKRQWGWVRAPPACTKPIGGTSTAWRSAKRLAVGSTGEAVKKRRALAQKRLVKDFACLLCGGLLCDPVSTPCQHSFCLACLQQRFHGQADTRDRSKTAGRSLRAQKIVKQCPAARCTADIADVLSRLQVNHDMADLIAMLLAETHAPDAEEGDAGEGGEGGDAGQGGEEDGEEGADGEEDEADEEKEEEGKDRKGQAEGKEREGSMEGAGEERQKEEGRSKGLQALDAIGAAGSRGGAGEGEGKGAQGEVEEAREGGVDGGKAGGVVGALSPTSGGVAGVTTASALADAATQGAAAKGMAAVGTAVERAETEGAAAGKESAATALVACSSLAGVPEDLREVMREYPEFDQATLRDMLVGEAGGDVEELRGMLKHMRCHQQQGGGASGRRGRGRGQGRGRGAGRGRGRGRGRRGVEEESAGADEKAGARKRQREDVVEVDGGSSDDDVVEC
ncbi:unnamed protein product [Closterium sp. NIES-53]